VLLSSLPYIPPLYSPISFYFSFHHISLLPFMLFCRIRPPVHLKFIVLLLDHTSLLLYLRFTPLMCGPLVFSILTYSPFIIPYCLFSAFLFALLTNTHIFSLCSFALLLIPRLPLDSQSFVLVFPVLTTTYPFL
jgi:hypothetical protein